MWFQHGSLNHIETEHFSQKGKVGNQTLQLCNPSPILKLSQCSLQRLKPLQVLLSAFLLLSLAVGMGDLHWQAQSCPVLESIYTVLAVH